MSSPTGASSFSSTPSSSSRSGRASVSAWVRICSRVIRSGSSRSLGPRRTVPGGVAALDQVVDAVADGRGVGVAVDPRAAPPRKCSLPGTRPRPGRPLGTSAATLRSTSESTGSPSRSSSRVPKTSRIAARKSAHRPLAVTTCRPKVSPRAASCWISVSRSSKSDAERAPAVDDEEHVAVPVVGAARPRGASGRSRSSRCPARGSTPRAGPRRRTPRPRPGGPRPARSGCRRRRRAAAGRAGRRCRRRSPGRRSATPGAWWSATCSSRWCAAGCSCRCADRRPPRRARRRRRG